MATRKETVVHYVDDLDGGKAEGTVAFAFAGSNYEIDLSKRNRTAFEKAVAPYVQAARKVRPARGRKTVAKRTRGTAADATSSRERMQSVRQWAKQQGFEVADRGRVSQEILDLYDGAH